MLKKEDTSRDVSVDDPVARVLAFADRYRRAIFAALAIVYFLAFTGRWRVNSDSALYMVLGRSLAEGAGYTYAGQPHTWYEPGLPWVIAASFRVFGQDTFVPILAFILACSAVGLMLTYALLKRVVGRPTAVLVTALVMVSETYLRYGYQVVSDTPCFVALMCYLLAYEVLTGGRHRGVGWWFAWLGLGASVLVMGAFRPIVITLIGALAVATGWNLSRFLLQRWRETGERPTSDAQRPTSDAQRSTTNDAPPAVSDSSLGVERWRLDVRPSWQRALVHVLILVLTASAYAAFRQVDPRRNVPGGQVFREATLRDLLTTRRAYAVERMFSETLPSFMGEILPEAVIGFEPPPGMDWAVSIVVLSAAVALFARQPLWGAWVAATGAQSMFWIARERYTVPILPMLLLGIWLATAHLARRLGPRRGAVAVGVVIGLLVLPNLVLDVRYAVEQRGVGITAQGEGDPNVTPLIEMGRAIHATLGKADIAVGGNSHPLTYFSRRRVEPPTVSARWPATPEQEARYNAGLLAGRALYVVLPDESSTGKLDRLLRTIRMTPGPALATVERPTRDRREPLLTLHRLERERRE